MAWLSGYSNRIKIPINASSDGALSNFQVRLNIVASTGTNVAGTIYLQDLSLEWPYDIRFTSSDGLTLIDHWRLEYDVTDGTWIVEVPSIAAEGTTDIYLYYGKADDTDASNIYNTCIVPSDDFRYSGWITKSNMPWTVADETAEVYDGKIYVIGGYNSGSSNELTTIQEYNPADDSWTAKTAMPTGRWGLMAVQVGGNIYVFGGDKDAVGQTKLEIYSISGNSWSTGTAPPAAIGYQGITGCSDGTDIYLQYKQYLYKYNVSEGTYTQLNAAVPGSRTWVVMSYYSGSLYLLTGYKYADGSGACPTVSIYNIAGNSWSTGTDCPYNVFGASRENVILGDKIYIVHGQGAAGHFYSFVLVYDISDNSWTEMSPGPYSDDGCAGSFYNGKYYVFGGRKDTTGPYGTNGVSVYDPTNDVAQSRWDWLNCGLHECPDDMFRTKSLSSWSHAGARSKNTVDTDNTWIEFDFTPVVEASTTSQNIEFLYANDDISAIYWYVYRNISDKISVYTRQSSTGANRWISTQSYTIETTYHVKIKDTGTAVTVYLQSSSGADIENSGSINYDTTTQKIQLLTGNTNDEGKYKNLFVRKYTANDPTWATPGDVENESAIGFRSILARQIGGAHISETPIIALEGIINNNCLLSSTSSILKYLIGITTTISINNNSLSSLKQLSGQIINVIYSAILLSNFISIVSSVINNSELTATTIYKNILLTGQSIIASIVEGLQEVQRNLYGTISTITKLESALIKAFNIVGQSITISSVTNQYISIVKNINGLINTNVTLSAVATIVHVGFVELTGLINSSNAMLSSILASKEINGLVNNTIILTTNILRLRNIIGLINTNIISNVTTKLDIKLIGTIENIILTYNNILYVIKSLSGTINTIIVVSNNYMMAIKNIIGYINTNIVLASIATVKHFGSIVLAGIINNDISVTSQLLANKTISGTINTILVLNSIISKQFNITGNIITNTTFGSLASVFKTINGNVENIVSATNNYLLAIKNITGHINTDVILNGIATITHVGSVVLTGIIDNTSSLTNTSLIALKTLLGNITNNVVIVTNYLNMLKTFNGDILTNTTITNNLAAIKNLIGHIEHNISLSGIINTYNLILITGQIITSVILTTSVSVLKNITGIISTNSIFTITYELARNLSGNIIITSVLLGNSTRMLLLSGIITIKTYLSTIYTEASTVYHSSITAISRFIKDFRGGSKL